MTSSLQTVVALAIVALAAVALLWHFFGPKKQSGCAGNCGAVSPEVKALKRRLEHRH